MKYTVEDSRKAWEANALFWDTAMGDHSNAFHRKTVRPKVNALLDIQPDDFILDIGCGNGNYSAYLAQHGVEVVAFDYSSKMIELAKKRQMRFCDNITFCVADATDEKSIMSLKKQKPFTKAVSNMAIMDISEVETLFHCINQLLTNHGVFVFATQHPCFVTLTEKYMTPHSYYGEAIQGQPQKQCYYHRSLQDIFHLCFQNGFIVDAFDQSCFANEEIPHIKIVRARKDKNIEIPSVNKDIHA